MNAKWAFTPGQEPVSSSIKPVENNDLKVDVSFTLKKKHAFLTGFGLVLVLLIGFTIGYNTSDPATFGHTWGEMTCVDCIVSANAGIGALAKTDVSTTGPWIEAEIPTLSKSKISATGTWLETDLPTISKSKISATGTWTAAEIPTALTALTVDTTTLHVDTANDRVGIGTTSPSTILSLRKDGDLTETNIQQTITSNVAHVEVPTYVDQKFFPGIVWTTTDNQPTKPKIGIWGKMKNTGTELRFGTSNNYVTGITNTAMVIDETGQVGIGQTTPGAKLEVAGQIKITGGSPGASKVLTSDAGGLASWSTPSGLPSGTSGQTLRNDGSNWVANSLLFNNGTNIGIGTASPITQLHVSGSVPSAATGSVATGTTPYNVYVQGRYAYVVNFVGNTLQVFDVSNPASPTSKGSVATGTNPAGVYVQGRYAYVVNSGSNTLQVFDVSNPAAPTSIGSVATGTYPRFIYVQGRYAYLGELNALRIVDVSNPASPTSVGSIAMGYAQSVYVQGRYAYVVTVTTDNISIVDVSNPASPALVGSAATYGTDPTSVYVQGRYAYVTAPNSPGPSLEIYDVANPTAPTRVGSITTIGQAIAVYVQGRYAYVVNYNNNALRIVDVSNPASPTSVGSVSTGSIPNFVYVQGRYAYVTTQSGNTLQIFDVGGAYIQQLEAGGIETGTLAVRNNAQVNNDLDVKGGVNIGSGGLFSAGNVNFSGSAGTKWTNVAFGTGWSNYLSGYQTVQYKKFGDLVFIRGLANSGANAWSTYPTIFTLPAGFRPAARLMFAQEGNANALVRVDILTTGEVQWNAGGAGSNWISLDGVVFSVD